MLNDKITQYYKSRELLSITMKMTCDRESALDLVHEAILKILDKKESYTESESFLGYFKTVAFRIHSNNKRHQAIKAHKLEQLHLLNVQDNSECIDYKSFYTHCYNKLTDNQKDLLLYKLKGYKSREIASITNIPINTVYSRVTALKNAIKKQNLTELI